MSWIGLSDLNIAAFDPAGVHRGSNRFSAVAQEAILPVGTLLIETVFTARARRPQRLLRFERRAGWLRALQITLDSQGLLTVALAQGATASHARLHIDPPPPETCLRITYGWDAPGRRAILTLENLDQELIYQVEAPDPLPLPLSDLREIILSRHDTRLGHETRFIALSDRIEPVGLPLGVAAGTPVETPSGPRLIERLRLGDEVLTWRGEARPVRWIARREVPALGRFAPLRLRAPYHGLTRDILCAPDHRVLVSGADTEYHLGQTSVLVEAAHLVDDAGVRFEHPQEPTIWYHNILLDGHECLKYAGMWAESLFVGAMGRNPELMATTALADLPASAIPRHTRFALPVVSGVQARALAHSMSA